MNIMFYPDGIVPIHDRIAKNEPVHYGIFVDGFILGEANVWMTQK